MIDEDSDTTAIPMCNFKKTSNRRSAKTKKAKETEMRSRPGTATKTSVANGGTRKRRSR